MPKAQKPLNKWINGNIAIIIFTIKKEGYFPSSL